MQIEIERKVTIETDGPDEIHDCVITAEFIPGHSSKIHFGLEDFDPGEGDEVEDIEIYDPENDVEFEFDNLGESEQESIISALIENGRSLSNE